MQSIRIALDAFGGDNAPQVNVDGAFLALKEFQDLEILLVGREEDLKPLIKESPETSRISIVDAREVFPMSEKPSLLLRKKETSLYKAAIQVKDANADALVSAGNTGGVLAAALFVVGRIKGVDRGAIAVLVPSKNGFTILIDAGANAEARAEHLRDFGTMGYEYAKLMGREKPKVGLLNVGEEQEKGTELTKLAFDYLKNDLGDSFAGNVEGRDINYGDVDVVVCSGFDGNIAMKTMEGTGKLISATLKKEIKKSGLFGIIGALFLKRALGRLKKTMDPSEYGGAFILGVKGAVVKAHGNSNALAIKNAIRVAYQGVKGDLIKKLEEKLGGK
ncbi:phosphate acyltransferase PlsX [Mesotoga prima]|uniref:phosphate acyltransferase PlsX n=1 Tax=Mesotoga prima TaxID=1184387 RepID=UPI0002CA5DE6|nr:MULTISPECIES: phosphate acyltransferase PlsX [Mesotoga]CCU85498.1 Phosphate acyltransferase [Mesotoga infera]MDK2944156.1 phosphate acyltransferase [Mesotoga sp.]HNQ71544.1 phosphate acyltransferase PlsX [Mesotoga prima]HNS76528.1 phosphate acyltransferase PlsX [Mesotoga prima]HQC14893.1 phosphate acyltransferase PlsX [Mesotoga prima]